MAKKITIEVTTDEAEALEAIRPYAREIAQAARSAEQKLPGTAAYGVWIARELRRIEPSPAAARFPGHLIALLEVLGDDALWMPSFWDALFLIARRARRDPTRVASRLGEAFNNSTPETAVMRDEFKAGSDKARAELERLFVVLRGRHRAGRVKRVDEQATETAVYRLSEAIEKTRGEERGSTRRALERLALKERVKPGALKKRITRRRPT